MKAPLKYVFGYGSLMNSISASKALGRQLSSKEIIPVNLIDFQRSWSLWDDVFSEKICQKVKGVYLNICPSRGNYTNGVIIAVNNQELENLIIREKNYECVDVTNLISVPNEIVFENFNIYSFVGKNEYLLKNDISNSYIFKNYVKIVEDGITSISKEFRDEFYSTTLISSVPILDGSYSFVDYNQQKKV